MRVKGGGSGGRVGGGSSATYNRGGSGRGRNQSAIRGKSVQKAADARFKSTGIPTRSTSNKAKSIAAKAAKRVGAEGPKRSAPVKRKK